jgi:hypothetical protein
MSWNHTKQFEVSIGHSEYERVFEWSKWDREIPSINFPKEWAIKIIPPFGNAIIRFRVNKEISVYLDCYGMLGAVNEPYWEIYPTQDNDTFRCSMNDTDELLKAISEALGEDK